MSSTLKFLRALSDPTRLRIIAVLQGDELSVHELQQITRMGQSRISTHLGLLQDSGLVDKRRDGKRTFYRLVTSASGVGASGVAGTANRAVGADLEAVVHLALRGAKELPEFQSDQINLRRILSLRKEQEQVYFNQVAGRFDRVYGPGRSWQALGQLLLRMLPALEVADLGSGEGLISELLARRCKKVIAVDNSEKIVAFGAAKARKNNLKNLEFRLGNLENPPIQDQSVDVAILSQALHHASDPLVAIRGAFRILRPGGRLMVLDLAQHKFEQAHELFGDRWLGLADSDLHRWLEGAGFKNIEISVVAREEEPPHFETLLAVGQRPA